MKNIKLFAFSLLLVLLLVLSLMALSASATTLPAFTLSSSSVQIPIVLPMGTTFNGSITTSGTIRVWGSDPNGSNIFNLGLVDKTATFSFVAQQDGNYTLNFENDLPNSVQVSFSYTTNPALPEYNSGIPLFYLAIPIIIAIVGSSLIIFFGRHKRKKETLKINFNGFKPKNSTFTP